MEIDRRVLRRYETSDEDARLWQPGRGDLVRLRTWDIFERFLPRTGRVLDVGGGPGTHAAHLAARGYDVTLVDPVPGHVELARRRAGKGQGACFEARLGVAADLPAGDGTVDVVLLMGPLYHLVERSVDTGLSQDPGAVADGSFWAYFHRPDELQEELAEAGFGEIELVAVEGYAWLLGDLDTRMTNPEPLLQAIRLIESEPSMLGCSAHVIGIA